MDAIDLIRRTMESNGFALRDCAVYKKIEEAKFTFVYWNTVKTFVLNLMGNPKFANVLTPVANTVIGFLSEPACRLRGHPLITSR